VYAVSHAPEYRIILEFIRWFVVSLHRFNYSCYLISGKVYFLRDGFRAEFVTLVMWMVR
jgi:hypothetical protein